MSAHGYAHSFCDLVVYRKMRAATKGIFELSKGFPREELYSLTDQIRRSSRSVGAQIAEAWAKRRYARHFVSKLTDADGELQETQHWLLSALDVGYLADDQVRSLSAELSEVGRMLNAMIEKADAFCGEPPSAVYELAAEYFASASDH